MSGGQPSVWQRTVTRVERLDSERVGLALLILAMAAAVTLLLWIERGALFSTDEWSWLDLSGTEAIDEVLRPLNQHLMALPLLIYKGILEVWGLDPLAFKLGEMVAVIACSALLYFYSRRRIGPILALAPAMMPLFFGTGTAIILQPLIGIQLIFAAVFGLGALVAVEREEHRWDVVACVSLFLSLCCFSFGITFLVGIAVSVMLGERRWQRAYVFVIPAALYAIWRLWAGIKFGLSGGPELENVPALPFYYVDSFAATVTALFGMGGIVGAGQGTALFLQGVSLQNAAVTVVFATLELVVVVYAVRRLWARRPIPATFWTALAILFTLWTLQGLVLNIGRTPGETRYLYAGSIAFLLVVVEFARGARLSRIGVILVLAVAVAGIAGNLPRFKEGRDGIVLHSTQARAYTAVMELAEDDANPDFIPAADAPEVATAGVLYFSVAQYFELASRYDTFAYSVPELMAQSEEVRNGADTIATDILELRLQPAPRLLSRGCSDFQTGTTGGFIDLPRDGVILQASAATPAALRRFADRTVVPLGDLEAGQPSLLEIPADRAETPWKLDVEGPLTLTACRLP